MPKRSPWVDWAPQNSSPDAEIRSLLRAVMGLHSTFSNEIWLWRGQADSSYRLEPGMHTRLRNTEGVAFAESNVVWATSQLIRLARQNNLDRIGDLRLPDLALLAHLQHHGAATPMLDVTVDPLVGLWMTVHASGTAVEAMDDRSGTLFAIRRPGHSSSDEKKRWIEALDSRPYTSETDGDVAGSLDGGVWWYRPPDISERLRIQRGSFVLGRCTEDDQLPVSLGVVWTDGGDGTWLAKRVDSLGRQGRPATPGPEVVAFHIRRGLKSSTRDWLAQRAGLSQQVIFPTPWNRPYLEDFCQEYGRSRPIDLPSALANKGGT